MGNNVTSKKNEGFKLLAITPLCNCGKDYRKSLKEGKVYQFYKNYNISVSNDLSEIRSARKEQGVVPDNFFDLNNGIKLNISAVVGENGSGKSSLFELLYYLIYQIFISLKVNGEHILEPKSREIEQRILNIETDLRIQKIDELLNQGKYYDDSIELRISELINEYKLYSLRSSNRTGTDLQRELLKQLSDTNKILKEELEVELQKEFELSEKLAISVLFEKENGIYELNYSNKSFSYNQFKRGYKEPMELDSMDVSELSQLSYTESINYSAHSLNSLTVGNWISRLFHKNDAYLTPLVINPMRTEGNFDINREMHLSKERLLSNMIYDHFNEDSGLILEKYQVDEINFSVKKNYRFVYPIDYSQSFFSENIVGRLIKSYISHGDNIELSSLHERALAYLDKKIEKIKENYGFLIFGTGSSKNSNDILLKFLLKDDSHITKKVKQTLNFIRFTIEQNDHWKIDELGNCTFTFNEMINWINYCVDEPRKLSPYKLIEYCFPGYFDVNFKFSRVVNSKEADQDIKLEKMSSGELQMILNINSIQYHLYNLQSVHDDTKENIDAKTRVKYKYVNIILDEIELYYHPDMQREMVKNIRKSIGRIKRPGESGIAAINICFLTHSPFILSDIPNENVLRLLELKEVDLAQNEEETFAANIQDILGNGFFMKILIGEFAFEKLIGVFNSLKEEKNEDTLSAAKEMLEYIGDPLIKNQLKKMIND